MLLFLVQFLLINIRIYISAAPFAIKMYYVDAILNAQESDFEHVGMVGMFFLLYDASSKIQR